MTLYLFYPVHYIISILHIYLFFISGGVQRGWEGVPRKYFKPGQKNFRCACVKEEFVSDPSFKEFDGCSVEATRCKITDE